VVLGLMRDALPRDQLGYAAELPWLRAFFAASALVAALVARYFSEPANAALRRRSRATTSGPLIETRSTS